MTFNLLSQLTDRSTNNEDEDEGSPVDDVGVETDDESDVNFDVEEGEGDGLRLDSSDNDESEYGRKRKRRRVENVGCVKAPPGTTNSTTLAPWPGGPYPPHLHTSGAYSWNRWRRLPLAAATTSATGSWRAVATRSATSPM
ncbi:hypothetical protein PoB_002747000 [Plakobranchus ocellatus]|uniref:Uncharacterized protein n=1 Tax=Plakobranchus ocellatus TaxID=259542 RepID=A0AAV4A0M8_9GAST|nr:hypothetical protein PoB_002747000 [Plakobranchus ocellatus]